MDGGYLLAYYLFAFHYAGITASKTSTKIPPYERNSHPTTSACTEGMAA
jgi:hypothetical protein